VMYLGYAVDGFIDEKRLVSIVPSDVSRLWKALCPDLVAFCI